MDQPGKQKKYSNLAGDWEGLAESIYIYIDSGGVVRTLIFTFMVKHTVFAG